MMSFSLSGGVEVYGFIAPTEITDEYPVIDPLYGIDGFRNVDTLNDLNNIPTLRRRAGMVVGIGGGTQYYKLNPGPWNGTITDWTIFNSGGGGGTFTGGTITGPTIFTNGLTANTLTVNGVSITGNTYTTGGTYSNGTIDFYYNTGGGYQVVGLYTGQTSYVNSLTTGTGLSADTTTGNITIINTNPDQIVSISGGTGILTGGTYPNFTIENTLPDQVVTLSGGTGILTGGTYPNFTIENTLPDQIVSINGGTGILPGGTYPNFTITNTAPDQVVNIANGAGIFTVGTYPNFTITNAAPDQIVSINGGTNVDVTGIYPNFNIALTGLTDNDTFTTGFTYNDNNTFIIFDSSGNTFPATINVMTGLTINGNLNVTGNTYSQNLTATVLSGGTIYGDGSNITNTPDKYITDLAFDTGNYNLTVTRNDAWSDTVNLGILSSDMTITGGTYDPITGTATFTNNSGGTFNVTGFIVGYTDIRTTGFTYSANTFYITDTSGNTFPATINVMTGLTINGNLSVTGNTGLGTSTPLYKLHVSGDTYIDPASYLRTNNIVPADSNQLIRFRRTNGSDNGSLFLDGGTLRIKSIGSVDAINIFTDGNLGVRHVNSSGYTFDVNGNSRIYGTGTDLFAVGLAGNNTNLIVGFNSSLAVRTGWGNGGGFITTNNVSPLYLQAGPSNPSNNGNVALGLNLGTNTLGKFHIRGSGSTSASTAFYVENSLQSKSFVIRDDNSVDVGPTSGISQLNVSSPTFSVGTNVGYNPIYGSNVDGVFQVTNVGTFGTQVWIRPSTNPSGFNGNYWSYLLQSGYTFTVGSGRYVDLILRAGENGAATNTYFENNTGVRTMTISGTTGDVGIGTSTPTARLHINNTSARNSLLVEDDTNPDVTPFVIDLSGNTGIGTLTPTAKLSISGNTHLSGETRYYISNVLGNAYIRPTSSPSGLVLELGSSSSSTHIQILPSNRTYFYQSTLFTAGSPTINFGVSIGDRLTINNTIYTGSTNTLIWAGNNANTNIFKIQGDSKIAINKSTALAALDISGDTFVSNSVRIGNTGNTYTLINDNSIGISRPSDGGTTVRFEAPTALNANRQTARVRGREGVQLAYDTFARFQTYQFTSTIGLGTTVDTSLTNDFSTILRLEGTKTPLSSVARGANFVPTLSATSNNDTLIGLDINPTFQNSSFTGVTNLGLRVNSGTSSFGGNVALNNNALHLGPNLGNTVLRTVSSGNDIQLYNNNSTGNLLLNSVGKITFGQNTTPANWWATFFNTGNLVIQNGGTHVDAGYRLDVSGNTRVSGTLNVSGTTNLKQTIINDNKVNIVSSFTPTGSTDPSYTAGTIAWDDNYLYWKTSTQWLRVSGSTW